MASGHPIEPFPADTDRGAFGHWLTGFTDGEGSFVFVTPTGSKGKKTPYARFAIGLRADDFAVLRLIQSYFGCGCIYLSEAKSARRSGRNDKDKAVFTINRARDLTSAVIPHFDRYPLRSKKARDFLIWKEGVELIARTTANPLVRLGRGHIIPRWTPPLMERFAGLHAALRAVRTFNRALAAVPAAPTRGGNRGTATLTCRGETKLVTEWAEQVGIPYMALHLRLRRGWLAERAIFTPLRNYPRK